MLRYKITIEYDQFDGKSKERLKLEPVFVEAGSFAEAITSPQVAEAINRLDTRMLNKEVDSLPPEAALEVVTSSAYLSSVQLCAEVEETLLS
jgi:hypothetical protein